MNLIDMFTRKEKAVDFPEETRQARFAWGGKTWRTLIIPARSGTQMRMRDVVESHPAWMRPETLGLYAACTEANAEIILAFSFVKDGNVIAREMIPLNIAPTPLTMPWPVAGDLPSDAELVLEVLWGNDTAEVQILVQRIMTRKVLYDLAKGTGIEVGPGPRPQIFDNDETSVLYVEETHPEEWAKLYDKHGIFEAKESDWTKIRIGKAAALPTEAGSLDFIFSSHVFEHLANPLGHLKHWYECLRPDGRVLAVLPTLGSTRDRLMRPCGMEEFLIEYEDGGMEPQRHHFERFAARRYDAMANPEQVQDLIDRSVSIHIHFYDNTNMAALLRNACTLIGYRFYQILYTPNHKDFYFTLTK